VAAATAAAATASVATPSSKTIKVAYGDDADAGAATTPNAGKSPAPSPAKIRLNAVMERMQKQLDDGGKTIQKRGSRGLVYVSDGTDQKPVFFKSQRDAVRGMGVSHSQIPKMKRYGDVQAASSAMKRKGFTGQLMAISKADSKKLDTSPAPISQRQSNRTATIDQQRVNSPTSNKTTK